MSINGNKIGYVFDGNISEDMLQAGCFQDEWLLLWFRNLLEVVKLLRQSDYVILAEIESPTWIEFIKQNDQIKVKELKKVKSEIPDFKSSSMPGISTHELIETVWLKSGVSFQHKVEFEETDFIETTISLSEFKDEVYRQSLNLLKEIKDSFPNLTHSNTLIEFQDLINCLESSC